MEIGKRGFRRYILAAVLIPSTLCHLPSRSLHAQTRKAPVAVRDISVRFEHLTVADGLSQTTIYDIYQDRYGFMWFATQDGLNRYDGHSMKVYRHVPFDPSALGDNTIAGITEDREGYLWIAAGRGLYRMDRATETFTAFRSDPNDPRSLGSDFVRYALEDQEGRLWIATQNGLDRFNRRTGEFFHYRHDPSDPSSISHNGVSWIYEDSAGNVWVTAANGLNRMRPDLSGFDRFLMVELGPDDISLINYRAQRLLERPEQSGILWIASNEGLIRLNPETAQSETFTLGPAAHRVADLVQDPIARNVLWLAVPGSGLGRFDIRTGRFSVYGTDPTDLRSLSTANTERVFVDRSGMLWVGVNGVGVDRFNPATAGMSHFRHDPGNPESLPGSHVRGIHQAAEGLLWVGTTDRQGTSRLSRFDPQTRTFLHFEHRSGDPRSIGDGRIRSVLVDRAGAVWVGTGGSGLNRLPPGEVDRFQHYRHDPSSPASLSHDVVRYLFEDESGNIWVATNGGLDRLESVENGTFFHYRHDPEDENTLTGDRISVIFESRAGFIWAGADGGLNRLDPLTGDVTRYHHLEGDVNSLASEAVLSIHERNRDPGIVWVGTFGGGLSRLQVSDGSFTHYLEEDGLPNNTVYGILEDDQGHLWMSTNVGLARFDPGTESFRSYGLDVGLQSLEFNSVASHRGPFGEMFFGGVNGLNAFFPEELSDNMHPPEVVIVDVQLSHRSIEKIPEFSEGRAVPGLREIRLRHDQTDLTFDYVGLHFQNPSQNVYAYRLAGYDDDWINAGSRRTASYTNLPPGDYTFQVRAANSDGVWGEEGDFLRLTITPPWWRTWWAFAAYLIVILGAAVGVHRIQSRRLLLAERERSRERELEAARAVEAAYNHLKATQEQLIQAEKMASLGHLTAGIAHEIRNPLNFVNNFTNLTGEAIEELSNELEKHRESLPSEFVDEFDTLAETIRYNTDRVREHGQRADAVVKNMLRHSLSSKSERHPTDLNVLLRDYTRLVKRGFEAKYPDMGVEIVPALDDDLDRIDVVPQDIGRVFVNLLNNAFEALHDRKLSGDEAFVPRITVSTERKPDVVEIRIADNGSGVSSSLRDKIFNPFFTTREVGEAAGLGLSMSYEIVAAHGGILELDDDMEEGAAFIIRLPV